MMTTDRGGVSIDYCPRCRGVWLDRGELDKILAAEGGDPASPSPAHPAHETEVPAPPTAAPHLTGEPPIIAPGKVDVRRLLDF